MELNLAKPGKLAATADYAKDFTFFLLRTEHEPGGFEEGDANVGADDLVFKKDKVAAQKTGGEVELPAGTVINLALDAPVEVKP